MSTRLVLVETKSKKLAVAARCRGCGATYYADECPHWGLRTSTGLHRHKANPNKIAFTWFRLEVEECGQPEQRMN